MRQRVELELPVCSGDIFSMAPQEKLCTAIDAGEGYSCELTQLPTESHATCHETHAYAAYECREWLDGLIDA
jgi:hypothetical protein